MVSSNCNYPSLLPFLARRDPGACLPFTEIWSYVACAFRLPPLNLHLDRFFILLSLIPATMCRHCWREEMGYDSDWDSAMDMYDDPEMDEDMQRGMNHLPNEILDQICQLLSPNDLKSLRLVCSRPVITANLFSYCHLEPTTASYKAVTKLSQNPQLKQLVRKVIYSLTNR